METKYFGTMKFDTGWKTSQEIFLFGKSFKIIVKAKAYFEKDGITPQQENAFFDYYHNKESKLKTTEILLSKYTKENPTNQFTPKTLLFNRDGSYAILFDDKDDEDDGIVVCLSPTEEVMTQDEYL